jgi:hypothetical protein
MQASVLPVACGLLICACNRESDEPAPDEPLEPGWELRYAACVTDLSENVPLPVLAGKTIRRVVPVEDEETDWLAVEAGATTNGIPSVKVTLKEWRPTGLISDDGTASEFHPRTKDSVTVQTTDGVRLCLVINQAHIEHPNGRPSGTDGNVDDFRTNWEHMTAVKLSASTHSDPLIVNLPWASSANITFPASMRKDVKSADGWQVAFCLFDADGQRFNYFGLANKYTGTLRIYYYHPTVTSPGGEFSILLTPNSKGTPKTPFYHNWYYGIPLNHADVHKKENLFSISDDPSQTFQNLIVPYAQGNKCILSSGWYAFDVDMSAYSPPDTRYAGGDGLQFYGKTQNTTTVSLIGTIQAKIGGTFDYTYTMPTAPAVTATQGFVGWLGEGASLIAPVVSEIEGGHPFAALLKGVSAGASLYSKLNPSESSGGKPGEGSGRISLDLTGSLWLDGYLNTTTSNEVVNAVFDYDDMFHNTTKGVWSLQSDPVICVVKGFALTDPGYYSWAYEPQSTGRRHFYELYPYESISEITIPRMLAFLDPASIKINLATESFSNLSDVNVSWCIGLYPNQGAGHTSPYREYALGLPRVGFDPWGRKENWYKDFHYPIQQHEGKTHYYLQSMNISAEDLVSSAIEGRASDCRIWRIPQSEIHYDSGEGVFGSSYSVYGKSLSGKDGTNDQFVIDPQVFFVRGLSESLLSLTFINLYEPLVPDYVVWVMVTFKYTDGAGATKIGAFSKRFLPDVRVVSNDELRDTYKPDIKEYINKCQNGATIQTVGNNVPVTHKGNDVMLYKINKVLDRLDEITW